MTITIGYRLLALSRNEVISIDRGDGEELELVKKKICVNLLTFYLLSLLLLPAMEANSIHGSGFPPSLPSLLFESNTLKECPHSKHNFFKDICGAYNTVVLILRGTLSGSGGGSGEVLLSVQ